ncbi:MAG: hypothetical protein QOC92_2181 [Acidimicrobiaceae bacterium]|jgi:DNA-binding NarL/FixJ family response regulator/class 3 adenylate cyclase
MAGSAALPSGVVSFLLTDVEGSTALWDTHRRAMTEALRRHDELLTEIVARHQGTMLKARGEGDSTFSVFVRATDAVAGAVAAQRGLAELDWPADAELRVRMAVHTGEAVERAGDYFGSAVNRAARLRSLARGGQVLLSRSTADLVADHLDDDVRVVEVGEQVLIGLSRPERVFALSAEGVTAPTHLPEFMGAADSGLGGGGSMVGDSDRPSVLVVDDHPLWRQTVRSLLERAGAASAVFEAADGREAVEAARARTPGVVIMDMALPGAHGIDATREITQANPETRVLVLSSSDDADQVVEAVQAGATGYLLKTAEPAEILEGVRRVHAGELVFPPSLTALVLDVLRGGGSRGAAEGPLARLTEREVDVLALMAEGHTNEVVGGTLHLSAKTVERHVTSIFRKLDLDPEAGGHRRVLAVIAYLRSARGRTNPHRNEG